MKITPDTNVLVRAALLDDAFQGASALAALQSAELIALPLATLCEYVWVLRRGNKRSAVEIARSLQQLLDSGMVETNLAAANAGIAMLLSGGDFADGVIAYEGRQLGGTTFLTFDKEAAALVGKSGGEVDLLPAIAPSKP